MFNKLEDARELSAKINACSRLDDSYSALLFCLENSSVKKQVESIHVKYRQYIVSGLKYFNSCDKISGNGFVLINAKENIKDTIIGTISSIVSNSSVYEPGTSIVGMSYSGESSIKISVRSVGSVGRNLRELLTRVVDEIGGEVGGHEFACGATISRENEESFIDLLKKNFNVEVVKVQDYSSDSLSDSN